MTMDRSVKIGIGTSIIATAIFIYFLDPILSFCGRSAILLFSRVCSSAINRLFEQTALCSTTDYGFTLTGFVMGTLSGISLGAASGLISAAIRRGKDLPPRKPLFMRLSLRKTILVTIVFTLFVHAFAIFFLWSGWFQLKTVSSFNQHMKAVAPYLTEQEEELLWSRWTQMQSKQDYDKIYSDLRKVAEGNSVRLPENRVYAATAL